MRSRRTSRGEEPQDIHQGGRVTRDVGSADGEDRRRRSHLRLAVAGRFDRLGWRRELAGPGTKVALALSKLVLFGVAVTAMTVGPMFAGDTARGVAASTATCSTVARSPQPGPSSPAPVASPITGAASSQTAVVIVVPTVTILLLDRRGTPIAVRTNDGGSPSCRDYFLVTSSLSDAGIHRATRTQIDRFKKSDLTGITSWGSGWHVVPST